jgi:hypothetical protein
MKRRVRMMPIALAIGIMLSTVNAALAADYVSNPGIFEPAGLGFNNGSSDLWNLADQPVGLMEVSGPLGVRSRQYLGDEYRQHG